MRAIVAATAFLILTAPGAIARQADDRLDPAYERAIEAMCRTLETLPSYRVDVTLSWKTGDGHEGSNAYAFLFDRGGRYRIEIRPDGKPEVSLMVANDGKRVTQFMPEKKLYTQGPAIEPGELLEATPLLAASLKGSLIDSLTRNGLKDYILARSRRASLAGADVLDGRKVDHFHLLWGRDEEEFWIGPEGEALPRKLIRVTQFPGKDEAALKLTTVADLKWSVGKPFAANAFAVALPQDAKLVPDLEAALLDAAVESSLGKPAPDLTLKRLGGGEVKLGDYRGKQAVVLTFWASWSVSSVETLPGLARLEADAKGRAVAFLDVNTGEDAPAVAAFLKKQAYSLNALLDADSEQAARFGVAALPAVLVIDKGGTVKAVHVGNPEAILKALRDDLGRL